MKLYDYYMMTLKDEVLMSYKGPVTDVIMAEISRDIKNKLADNPRLSRKIFAVFIELAQNILFYSAEKVSFGGHVDRIGTLLLIENENVYRFSCGNLVESQYVAELVDACETINQLNHEELRKHKRDRRSQSRDEFRRSKGAGIGLIQVALTSGSPLNVEFNEIDDSHTFFTLSVELPKDI